MAVSISSSSDRWPSSRTRLCTQKKQASRSPMVVKPSRRATGASRVSIT